MVRSSKSDVYIAVVGSSGMNNRVGRGRGCVSGTGQVLECDLYIPIHDLKREKEIEH